MEDVRVTEYIESFRSETVRERLSILRRLVKEVIPDAEETVSYRMPAYRYGELLLYFAGYENHIGLYPLPKTLEAFEEDLKIYKRGKGSIQFPNNKPFPLELIRRMIEFRVKEALEKNGR